LGPQLEIVRLHLGQVLYESGATLSHVYFPTTSIVSLLYVTENGESAEIAIVAMRGSWASRCSWRRVHHEPRGGAERRTGLPTQGAGLEGRVQPGRPVDASIAAYTQALITQMAQTAVCNRHHTLDQQLCRWLLLSLDRLRGMDL